MSELTLVDQLEARMAESPTIQIARAESLVKVDLEKFANDAMSEIAFLYGFLHRMAEIVDALAGR
jgi:hypothetical protein